MWAILVLIGAFVLLVVVVAAVRTKRGTPTSARSTSHEEAKALGSHVDRGPW